MSLYRVLGVARSASKQEIKVAYRKLAMQFHPDKHAQSPPQARAAAAAKFNEVASAYETLSDDRKRAAYDVESPNVKERKPRRQPKPKESANSERQSRYQHSADPNRSGGGAAAGDRGGGGYKGSSASSSSTEGSPRHQNWFTWDYVYDSNGGRWEIYRDSDGRHWEFYRDSYGLPGCSRGAGDGESSRGAATEKSSRGAGSKDPKSSQYRQTNPTGSSSSGGAGGWMKELRNISLQKLLTFGLKFCLWLLGETIKIAIRNFLRALLKALEKEIGKRAGKGEKKP